jgi:hypothetical protein
MFNYLYYKLYQVSLKSSFRDIPEFFAPVFLGGLVSANILVISAFLAKINVMPFLFQNKEQGGLFALAVIVLAMFYYRKKRYRPIIKKYLQENDKKRIRGNVIVAFYVALSFFLIFAVAFFKPGKL